MRNIYQTREVIPDSLIAKIENQALFNQGFMTTELLAAAILDMEMHCLTTMEGFDVLQFEKQLMDKLGLIPQIAPRYRSTYFNHIMGGYAAGYYSYIWAERLDTDALRHSRNMACSTRLPQLLSVRTFWKKAVQTIR